MADIQLNWTGISGQTYKVEHKKDVDSTWTVDATGLTAMTYVINGLDGGTLYNFRVTATCPSGQVGTPATVNETTNPDTTFVWIEDTFTCEQTDPLTLGDTFTGFSSPQGLYWDATLQRYYVIDADDSTGNLYWIDPASFTGFGDQNYVAGSAVAGGLVQSFDSSASLRKIFMAGPNTSGVVVYDVAAGTFTTITTGTNGSFARVFCRIVGGTLYTANQIDNELILINPATNAILSTVDVTTIPGNTSNKYFNNAYTITAVNGELWVCAASRATNGSIARYNSTLTSFIGEITIPGVSIISGGTWGGRYWQSAFYDEDNDRFYIHDIGSNTTTIVNTSTNAVIDQITLTNLQGKTHTNFGLNINQLTNQMYASRQNLNDPSDGTQITRFYVVNRSNFDLESMYLDQTTGGLTLRTGTNEFWSVNPGLFQWSVPNTGYNTDGEIFKYTS